MSLEFMFFGNSFKSAVQKCSAQNGWTVAEISDRMAKLRFTMPSSRTQILYIVKFDTTMEFSVPSGMVLDSEDEFPGVLSTMLLRRNAQRKIGFWCIEQSAGKYAYSCMHNEDIQKVDAAYFARIVMALISECDEFDGIMLQMLR